MRTFIITLILVLYTSISFAETCPKLKYGDRVKVLGFYEKLGEGIVVDKVGTCIFKVELIIKVEGLPFVHYREIFGYDLVKI